MTDPIESPDARQRVLTVQRAHLALMQGTPGHEQARADLAWLEKRLAAKDEPPDAWDVRDKRGVGWVRLLPIDLQRLDLDYPAVAPHTQTPLYRRRY